MNAAPAPTVEHREDQRVEAGSSAWFEAPQAIFPQQGPARIEDISACGIRVRTTSPLHPDEELTLRVANQPFPVHARVIWVREETLRGRRTWLSGCQCRPESMARLRVAPVLAPPGTPIVGRLLAAALVIGFVALLVYGFVRLATILAGG